MNKSIIDFDVSDSFVVDFDISKQVKVKEEVKKKDSILPSRVYHTEVQTEIYKI